MPLNWETQTLRFSVFLKEPLLRTQDVWQTFTEQEPEIDERRTKESLVRQAGAWRAGFLEVRVVPIRLDILFTPPPVIALATFEMPRLTTGPWHENMTVFCERSRTVLQSLQLTTTRIALGGTLYAPAASRIAAYEQLRGCVTNVNIEPERMRDLIYRVNWPVMFAGPPPLELNRITIWSVETISLAAVMQGPGPEQVVGEHHFAKLEIDHNSTAMNTQVLDRGELVTIFEQLRILAFENCESGERK